MNSSKFRRLLFCFHWKTHPKIRHLSHHYRINNNVRPLLERFHFLGANHGERHEGNGTWQRWIQRRQHISASLSRHVSASLSSDMAPLIYCRLSTPAKNQSPLLTGTRVRTFRATRTLAHLDWVTIQRPFCFSSKPVEPPYSVTTSPAP